MQRRRQKQTRESREIGQGNVKLINGEIQLGIDLARATGKTVADRTCRPTCESSARVFLLNTSPPSQADQDNSITGPGRATPAACLLRRVDPVLTTNL
ncbi:hypothetical protein PoB_001834900 [Plakobranchus ocellatus]|uniref:Uncharacterized protein n=1 Tax=Plakobranchus ocellatus TaxID=259542 RepID=A0AAV3Z944_9GAST|nr:hypothetical protein PoB_001834900 [Plakobranchus ocellatus]